MTEVVLGVDVGGTTIAAGLVTRDGDVLVDASAPTHAGGLATAGQTLVELIERVMRRGEAEGHRIAGIGIGVPAIVDAATGRIGEEAPHIPDLAGQPLASMIMERFGRPTFVDNDVNALALAEWAFGLDCGARSIVVLAPGTGFGSGVILDGHLVRGTNGFGGEFGHTPVKFDGAACWCGGRGCLAIYASGRGIAEAARAAAGRGGELATMAGGDLAAITAPMVFRAAAAGDRIATGIVEEACRALGAIIGTIVNGLNPEVLVITGGVASAYQPLEVTVMRCAAEYAFPRALANTRIRIVPGDKRLTMRGAAALVLYETAALAEGRLR